MSEVLGIAAQSAKKVGATSTVQVKNTSSLGTSTPPRGVDSVQLSTAGSVSRADMDRYVSMLQNMQTMQRAEGNTPEDAIVNGLMRDL